VRVSGWWRALRIRTAEGNWRGRVQTRKRGYRIRAMVQVDATPEWVSRCGLLRCDFQIDLTKESLRERCAPRPGGSLPANCHPPIWSALARASSPLVSAYRDKELEYIKLPISLFELASPGRPYISHSPFACPCKISSRFLNSCCRLWTCSRGGR
jgi:hypothetical protein